jgi:hypothetical protein
MGGVAPEEAEATPTVASSKAEEEFGIVRFSSSMRFSQSGGRPAEDVPAQLGSSIYRFLTGSYRQFGIGSNSWLPRNWLADTGTVVSSKLDLSVPNGGDPFAGLTGVFRQLIV